jgi:hypothetical protein
MFNRTGDLSDFMEWYTSLMHTLCSSLQLLSFTRVCPLSCNLRVPHILLTCILLPAWIEHVKYALYKQEKKLKNVLLKWVSDNLIVLFRANHSSISVGDVSLTDFRYDFHLGKFLPKTVDDLVSINVEIEMGHLRLIYQRMEGCARRMRSAFSTASVWACFSAPCANRMASFYPKGRGNQRVQRMVATATDVLCCTCFVCLDVHDSCCVG